MRAKQWRPSGESATPRRTMSCDGVSPSSCPSNWIEPSRGGVRPEIDRSVVDLPAPFEPISVTISPSSTSSDTPFRASMLP
jgi:hypothetical protein